ncbi:MAG: PPC domain-containing DNA-binding protein [Acidobacteriota bacterium]
MKYTQGSIGRVIVAKVEHGDDLLVELKGLLVKENIKSGVMLMIGALQKGAMVVGPRATAIPPDPTWKEFDNSREIVGIGTVFSDGDEPEIHLHAALGRGDGTLTGCIRKDAIVYLVVEVIILEITGTNAVKLVDELTGLKFLKFL